MSDNYGENSIKRIHGFDCDTLRITCVNNRYLQETVACLIAVCRYHAKTLLAISLIKEILEKFMASYQELMQAFTHIIELLGVAEDLEGLIQSPTISSELKLWLCSLKEELHEKRSITKQRHALQPAITSQFLHPQKRLTTAELLQAHERLSFEAELLLNNYLIQLQASLNNLQAETIKFELQKLIQAVRLQLVSYMASLIILLNVYQTSLKKQTQIRLVANHCHQPAKVTNHLNPSCQQIKKQFDGTDKILMEVNRVTSRMISQTKELEQLAQYHETNSDKN